MLPKLSERFRGALHPLRPATKSVVLALPGIALAQRQLLSVQARGVGFFPDE